MDNGHTDQPVSFTEFYVLDPQQPGDVLDPQQPGYVLDPQQPSNELPSLAIFSQEGFAYTPSKPHSSNDIYTDYTEFTPNPYELVDHLHRLCCGPSTPALPSTPTLPTLLWTIYTDFAVDHLHLLG